MKITEAQAEILRILNQIHPETMDIDDIKHQLKFPNFDTLKSDLYYLKGHRFIEFDIHKFVDAEAEVCNVQITVYGIDELKEFDSEKEEGLLEPNNDIFNAVDINDLIENKPSTTNEVFIVHGRDEGAKEKVARFLEKLDLKPIILSEQASQGRTIIEKFEAHADVGFAVVLLTPDDVGALQGEEEKASLRPRQNAIFEMGFFVGRLERKRVCVLTKGGVNILSDYSGIVYISLDSEAWEKELIRELQAAGFEIDANKAW